MLSSGPQSSLFRVVHKCYAHSTLTPALRIRNSLTLKPQIQTNAFQLHRPFSRTAPAPYPRVDSQDKDSINRESTEYSKSGTDDQTAEQDDAAYNPNKTDPNDQRETAGKGVGNNPLDVSPANLDVSKQRLGTEGGAENSTAESGGESTREKSTSGGGSPRKGKKVS